MIERQHGEEAQLKNKEREVLIVGKLPADVVAEIEAAEYGVPTPPPSPPPRHGRASPGQSTPFAPSLWVLR